MIVAVWPKGISNAPTILPNQPAVPAPSAVGGQSTSISPRPERTKPAMPAKITPKKVEKKAKTKVVAPIKTTTKAAEKTSEKTKVVPVKKAEKVVAKTAPKNAGKNSAKNTSSKARFSVGDYAIYPSHGVGKIVGLEKTMIMGEERSIYQMHFEKERLHIKIPVSSADQIGLRHPITKSQMDEVFIILRSGVKKLKGMWSRRAQEYETKINSGDITLLAEVIRDLTRDIEDSERSYSERIIYETAIYRLTSEYVVIHGTDFEEAKELIINTAKDKVTSDGKVIQKDDFDDEFDAIEKKRSGGDDEDEDDEDEEDEDEDEEDEDDDYDYDDDDDAPKKKRKK
jgi:CarD family transcriptional regulator